jgi:energy-coupling factor transport system ATP-binding protein
VSGIRTRGLTVRYFGRDRDALADLDLDAQPGTLTGIAGQNGAGKSTLALALAGLIPRVVRAQVSGSVEADSGVGIVFSSPHNQISATKSTVREELAFGLENLGVPRGEMDGRIDAVIRDLRIEHLAERYPFELSGGEQQRVAIASILVMGTDVVVLDEPTAQLDPVSTGVVTDLMAQLAGDGSTVLVAEHDPTVLGRTSRCLVLDGGRRVVFDLPGRALGSAVQVTLGVAPPTDVQLAEVAEVPPEHAFDERVIAEGLRSLRGVRGDGSATTAAVTWQPIRQQPKTAIEVRALTHRYANGVEALRGVDLAIAPGQAVAIIGQNGSGKTTLVKHLDGLLRPTSGDVLVGGRSILGLRVDEVASTVGFVFQDPDDQLFGRTVERELRFGPRNLAIPAPEADRLVEAALAATGLTAERATNPYDLDRSARKLVALATVLAMDPAVLVLDEPTTGQDRRGVDRVGAIVDAWRGAGRTAIAITHDMEFAARHFDRLVVMTDGLVVADGPPGAIFATDAFGILASAGLEAPAAARIGALLGLASTPTPEALLDALRR